MIVTIPFKLDVDVTDPLFKSLVPQQVGRAVALRLADVTLVPGLAISVRLGSSLKLSESELRKRLTPVAKEVRTYLKQRYGARDMEWFFDAELTNPFSMFILVIIADSSPTHSISFHQAEPRTKEPR